MKVTVDYDTSDNRWIIARITVLDPEGFVSKYIFKDPTDYPTKDDYDFDHQQTETIRCHFRTPTLAKTWVTEQLTALRRHLRNWEQLDGLQPFTTTL